MGGTVDLPTALTHMGSGWPGLDHDTSMAALRGSGQRGTETPREGPRGGLGSQGLGHMPTRLCKSC